MIAGAMRPQTVSRSVFHSPSSTPAALRPQFSLREDVGEGDQADERHRDGGDSLLDARADPWVIGGRCRMTGLVRLDAGRHLRRAATAASAFLTRSGPIVCAHLS